MTVPIVVLERNLALSFSQKGWLIVSRTHLNGFISNWGPKRPVVLASLETLEEELF